MNSRTAIACSAAAIAASAGVAEAQIVDTAQTLCYSAAGAEIACPADGESAFGQDAQHFGHQPSYTIGADGLTVRDNITGLTWVQSPDTNGDGDIDAADTMSWTELPGYVAAMNADAFGGFDDWRVPSVKELYSLMDFRGTDPSGPSVDPDDLVPFVDPAYFAFGWGDTAAGDRIIDAQYWSSTEYVSTTMHGDATVFGVNFADGRIKGYPRDLGAGGLTRTQYVRLVRGEVYGLNDFVDNGDGTVTDLANGLVWQQGDSGDGMDWAEALDYCGNLTLAGADDWRLPNAKELQSLVDYSRSPDTTASAAIDPVFSCTMISNENLTADEGFYWTSTTHANAAASVPGRAAAYVAFGRGMGFMFGSWMDVHGAGCQRSDPKQGDLADYTWAPHGYYFGDAPQGDAIRIDNLVRCVRDSDAEPVVFSDGFETGGLWAW